MLTHNNHVKWKLLEVDGSLSPGLFRTNDFQKFDWEIGVCSKKPRSWLEEWNHALELMMSHYGTKFNVMYSGGIDSEVAVRSLVGLGADVVAHTIVAPDGSNAQEIAPAIEVCRQLGIRQVLHRIDFRNLQSGYGAAALDHCEDYQTNLLTHGLLMALATDLDDRPVIASNDVFLWRRENTEGNMAWQFPLDESYGSFHKFATFNQFPLIVELGMYTPEVMAAFLTSEPVQRMIARDNLVSLYSSKAGIYRELGIPLLANKKMIGWENNLAYGLEIARTVKRKNFKLQVINTEVQPLIDRLLGDFSYGE